MKLSEAMSRTDSKLKCKNTTFEKLAKRIKENPVIGSETYEEYLKLDQDSQTQKKDVGGFVLGKFQGGKRSNSSLISRSGLSLDLDKIGSYENYQAIVEKLNLLCCNYCLYSTRKSTKNNPRVRILIELSRDITPDEYVYISREICYLLGMEYCDPVSARPAQLMFYPSISSDMKEDYDFLYQEELRCSPLDPDILLTQNENWKSIPNLKKFPEEDDKKIRLGDKNADYTDPREKDGTIGLFNRAYSIPEALDTFLSNIYEPTDKPDRYTYIEGESTEGGVVYGRDEYGADVYFYSFHATDPHGGKRLNAFDLVRVWKFGDSNQKESTKAMIDFANKDEKVRKVRSEEVFNNMKAVEKEQAFELPQPKNGKDQLEEERRVYQKLLAKLSVNSKGEFEKTFKNYLTIMREDPKLKDSFYYDSFAVRPKVSKPLPWAGDYRSLPRNWEDDDVIGMMCYLETNYDMYSAEKIKGACRLSAKERLKHPVREYLGSLKWDGVKRLDTLLIDYFGAADNIYTREAIRKSLVAAVARVEEPGVKFDTMTILIGPQGIGKSTFLYMLGKDWFTDSYIDFSSKDGYQMLQGNWIIEIGELTGFYKKEVEQIKSFLSKREDEFRAPYDRYTQNHPRQCVIFGTTNAKTFLRDQTGNRRFWPIQLGILEPTKNVFKDLPNEIDQIWAEAYTYYKAGEKLILNDESERLAELARNQSLEADPLKENILNFILEEVPIDWHSRTISERKLYWDKDELNDNCFDNEEVETDKRTCISPTEIYCEMLGENPNNINRGMLNAITKILDTFPGLRKKRSTIYGKHYGNITGYLIDPEFYTWVEEKC